MSLRSDLTERLRALVFRRREERDLDEEVRFHLDREVEERLRAGIPPQEAQRQARLAFGGVDQYKEEARDARGVRPLQDLGADIRHAGRALRRNPVFTGAAILVLGLGIGATTVIFSIADRVVLSDLPYPDAGRLVRVYEKNSPTNRWSLSTVDAQAIQSEQRTFDGFGVVSPGEAALSGAGTPKRVRIGPATSGFFRALGLTAAHGRLVEPGDEASDAPPVVVVSHGLAMSAFGGAAPALGRAIALDGVSHTVIGVLPAGRDDLAGFRAAAWPALKLPPPTRRGPFWLVGIGRLAGGVTLEASARDLAGISERLFPVWASGFRDSTARLTPVPLREAVLGGAGRQIGLFAVGVALVLLVAVANVATLVLVRTSAREAELSVRAALGAGRLRLARLVIAECVVLTLLAGAAGLGLAAAGLRLVTALVPTLPRIGEVTLGGHAVAFAALLALASGLLIGASPAIRVLTRRSEVARPADHRRAGVGRRTNRLRGGLVAAEFALTLPLLVGAGLLLRSFLRVQRVDPGFDPAGVVSVRLGLPPIRYPDGVALERFWTRLEQRVRDEPGVVAAGISSALPPDEPGTTNNFDLIDRPVAAGTAEPVSPWAFATNGYFEALGVELLEGRWFTPADSGAAPPAVLVSRGWARRFYPGESPVGRQMVAGGCTACRPTTVIGVVGDVKYLGLIGSGDAVYSPLSQAGGFTESMNLVVRTRAAPAASFRAIREVVAGLDAELPMVETTLQDQLDASLADPFRWAVVLAAFAAVSVGLAAIGIFGLMSYVVRQRRREIGVRIALGAAPGSVAWMIVGRGMRYAVVGSAIGLGLALLEARWLGGFLFEIGATDPLTLAAVAGVLLGTALLACWVPGRRAARIHPIEAIGSD